MKKVKSLGTTRQRKKYKTYRGAAKDTGCIVDVHTTLQKTSTVTSVYQMLTKVTKAGQYRFSYTGQESEFVPWGICIYL